MGSLGRRALGACGVVVCSLMPVRSEQLARASAPTARLIVAADAPGAADLALLDGEGRAMLDPLRAESLKPARLIEKLALSPSDVVADLGAGPGFLTLPLARVVSRGRVIATDVNRSSLSVLARRAARSGLTNVETRFVEATTPGLAPQSIDLALLCQLDHALADRVTYFQSLVPSLKPGGRVAIVNYRRYRDLNLAAAQAAGLVPVAEWNPSAAFVAMVFVRAGDAR